MKTNLFTKLGFYVLPLFLLASCIDDKYDLNDVDLTIGTSGDLTLPISSTGGIVLKNLMDLKEDGVVQVVNGEYYIIEDGSADIPRIDIEPVTIPDPVVGTINTFVDRDDILSGQESRETGSASGANAGRLMDIPNYVYSYTIKERDKAYYTLEDAMSSPVPEEVMEIVSFEFVDNTTLEADVQIVFSEGYIFIDRVHMDHLSLNIPQGLKVAEASYSHWTITDGKKVFVEKNAISIDNEVGTVVFTDNGEAALIGEGCEIRFRMTFSEAVVGSEGVVFADRKVAINGVSRLNGTFHIETDEFNKDELTAEQIQSILLHGNYHEVCPEYVELSGSAAFGKDISIKSFTGKVQSSVGDISPIVLDDLPDFLNDPDVVFDLKNPAFFVEVDNPLPFEAKTSIVFSSVYKDGTPTVVKETGAIVVPANSKSVLCLADRFEDIAIPEKYVGLNIVEVPVANLNELLKKLPYEIRVDVADITMDIEALPIPCQYDVKVAYSIFTPLEFDEDFKLVYQGTEGGLSEDLKDVNKMDTKEVRITANVETDFPLDLLLSVDVLDRSNKSLKDKLVTVNDVVINAHEGPGNISEQPIVLTIKPINGHTIRELLETLDKFHYRAEAEAQAEGKLLESAHIKLNDVKITLVGGVSYDAN